MTPQELKMSILLRAVQGKLVNQDYKDGTAQELIEQIYAKKQELIRKKIIKKEISLQDISDREIPFEIPETWRWVRLRDVCTKIVDGDHNPPAGVNIKTNYMMLSAKNINNDSVTELDQVRYLTEDVFIKENERTQVHKGDIFFTIVGTLGRSCVFEDNINICFQRSVAVLTTLIYNYYLKYVLDSGYIQAFMVANSTGTAQKGFYLNQVEKLLIPVPPLAEQKRIVERIKDLLPFIDRYEIAWNRLETFNKRFPVDMQKSILQMAIQGKLVEQLTKEGCARDLLNFEQNTNQVGGQRVKQKEVTPISEEDKVFDIPETWEWVKLGSVCTIARGGSPRPIKEYLTTDPDGVNWIKIGDTEKNGKYISSTAEKIKPSGVSKSRMVHAGDFLLTNSMSFGRPYILKVDGCIHDGWLVISQSKEVFDQEYLYWMLSSGYAYSQFCGKVSGAVVKNLNSDKVANSVFPLPPLLEQRRIVAKLEEIIPLCERLK